eukprot:TRINITY_DN786_c0_g1_i1.p1 TRINITY_DN786_c0_g1~~TRINITY_DN786_c0_g1_i1.p1  ORF type:complete len:605 (+),score=125.22 TRINITY_DN786_c0_g1_i1:64-1878(+)
MDRRSANFTTEDQKPFGTRLILHFTEYLASAKEIAERLDPEEPLCFKILSAVEQLSGQTLKFREVVEGFTNDSDANQITTIISQMKLVNGLAQSLTDMILNQVPKDICKGFELRRLAVVDSLAQFGFQLQAVIQSIKSPSGGRIDSNGWTSDGESLEFREQSKKKGSQSLPGSAGSSPVTSPDNNIKRERVKSEYIAMPAFPKFMAKTQVPSAWLSKATQVDQKKERPVTGMYAPVPSLVPPKPTRSSPYLMVPKNESRRNLLALDLRTVLPKSFDPLPEEEDAITDILDAMEAETLQLEGPSPPKPPPPRDPSPPKHVPHKIAAPPAKALLKKSSRPPPSKPPAPLFKETPEAPVVTEVHKNYKGPSQIAEESELTSLKNKIEQLHLLKIRAAQADHFEKAQHYKTEIDRLQDQLIPLEAREVETKLRQLEVAKLEAANREDFSMAAQCRNRISELKVRLSILTTPPVFDEAFVGAARTDDLPRVKQLLSQGCNINSLDPNGQNALHCAALRGNEEMTKFLIQNGADVIRQDNAGRTPLHLSIEMRSLNVAESKRYDRITTLLINSGRVDPFVRDKSGKTCLDLAQPDFREELLVLYKSQPHN